MASLKAATVGQKTKQRVAEIDGLRGIAALWVVLYHLWGAIERRDVEWVMGTVSGFFHAGLLGVDIFFVLSGFVITHSVVNMRITPTFIPKFILRRSIRIDPPYWAAIAIAVAFMVLKNIFFPSESVSLPGIKDVIAHIFYLQDLLGLGNISSVFWTLCLEFQFYLIFGIVYHLYSLILDSKKKKWSYLLLLFGISLCAVSPALRFSSLSLPVPGTILPYSYEFILGVIAYHCANHKLPYKYLLIGALLTVGVTTIYKPIYFGLVPAVTLLIIYVASEHHGVSFLKSIAIQWLGKISYSMYLTHAIIGWVSISFLSYLLKGFESPFVTVMIFLTGLLLSIMFAYIFYRIVENPSLIVSRRFRLS